MERLTGEGSRITTAEKTRGLGRGISRPDRRLDNGADDEFIPLGSMSSFLFIGVGNFDLVGIGLDLVNQGVIEAFGVWVTSITMTT